MQVANRCFVPRIHRVRTYVCCGFASGWLQLHESDLYTKPNIYAFISFIQPLTFELRIITSFSTVVVSGRGQEWIAKPDAVAFYQIRVVALVSDGECAACIIPTQFIINTNANIL
jgi:hypothetical protein